MAADKSYNPTSPATAQWYLSRVWSGGVPTPMAWPHTAPMATPSRLTVTVTDPDGLVTISTTTRPMRIVHAFPFLTQWATLPGRGFVDGPNMAHVYTVVTP